MTSLTLDRFARAAGARTAPSAGNRLRQFVGTQRATLTASFRAARAYEQADTTQARREVLDRFVTHLRA